MAVVDHVLVWTASPDGCEAPRSAWRTARSGDATALGRLGRRRLARAATHRDVLVAFGLEDPAYRRTWTAPGAFDPALTALLAWIPDIVVVDPARGAAIAAAWRRDAWPGRPLRAIATRLHGDVGYDPTRVIEPLGLWVRLSVLRRRLRARGDDATAAMLAAWFPTDPQRTWLIINTLW